MPPFSMTCIARNANLTKLLYLICSFNRHRFVLTHDCSVELTCVRTYVRDPFAQTKLFCYVLNSLYVNFLQYQTEKDGVIEMRVEKRLLVNPEGSDDPDKVRGLNAINMWLVPRCDQASDNIYHLFFFQVFLIVYLFNGWRLTYCAEWMHWIIIICS